jgi:hypothetical protein
VLLPLGAIPLGESLAVPSTLSWGIGLAGMALSLGLACLSGWSRQPRLLALGALNVIAYGSVGIAVLARPPAWQELTPDGGGFRVELPGQPSYRLEQGPDIAIHRYELVGGDPRTEYHVGFAEVLLDRLLGSPDDAFANARAGLQAGAAGAILEDDRAIDIDGHPGRQLVFAAPAGRIVARVYLIDGTLVMLTASNSRITPDDVAATRFFESFRLTRAEPAWHPFEPTGEKIRLAAPAPLEALDVRELDQQILTQVEFRVDKLFRAKSGVEAPEFTVMTGRFDESLRAKHKAVDLLDRALLAAGYRNVPMVTRDFRGGFLLDGRPGKQFAGVYDDRQVVVAHSYLVDDRVYVAMVRGKGLGPGSPTVKQFFGSIRLDR